MHILIVCAANRCRSVMAQTILKQRCDTMHLSWTVMSAGVQAQRGLMPDPVTIRVLQRNGYLPDTSQRSKTLQEVMHLPWDLVLVMDHEQRQAVLARYPQLAARVMVIGREAYPVIPDPYRQGYDQGFKTLKLLEPMAQYWLGRLAAQQSIAS
jgi:protein-tyrosine phosphatase